MNRILRVIIKSATPLEAFGVFLLVAFSMAGIYIAITDYEAKQQQQATDQGWSLIGRAISANDHLIGDVSAPIQLIVYSSIACPTCARFFEQQVPKLQAAFGRNIVFAYRHNPIPQLPSAQIQEPASECVYQLGGNDAFWKFVRLLFPVAGKAQATDLTYLSGLAAQAGVSASGFSACMNDGKGEVRVEQDKKEAAIAGMTTDPSLLLKSPHRALVLYGDRYSQIYTSIKYLLTVEGQVESR